MTIRNTATFWMLLLLLVGGSASTAAAAPTDTTVVDRLVREALETNLALQQQEISLERSRKVLAEARGRFFPSLDVRARYTRASGGRTIDFPVGDLLNPVYNTLNEVLQQQGQQPRFSEIENQEINFIREREQDTRLELRQPLFAPRVLYGYRASKHQVSAQSASVETFQRELVRDVQTAYYNYRKAQRRIDILQAAETLVAENKRTNESLYAADRVTQDAVFRAEAEVLAIRQQIEEARAGVDQARRFVNFLLNRSADAPIPAPQQSAEALVDRRSAAVQGALAPVGDTSGITRVDAVRDARPELDRLRAATDAAEAQERIAKSAFLPTVSLAFDAGIQGETYGFDDDKPFYLGSVVLEWNLFNGFQDAARVEQRQLEVQRLERQREEVARQIGLEVREAVDAVRVAQRSLRTADARVRAARESFRITQRRYEAGRANQVTFIDARSTLTEAELNLNVTRYDLLTRLAELEYAAGLYALPGAAP